MTCGNLPDAFTLSPLRTNGISVRAAVEGSGPLVIMVHGWPELWYSWRHQIKPIAAAGYRVVAPDVRGYGGSDKPYPVAAYDMATIMADIVGLIDALGEERAILIGHDWGAPICWNTAVLHPERVAAVAGLSVPYRQRPPVPPMTLWRQLYQGRFFYQLYFQDEGVAERELEADVRQALRKIYYLVCGEALSSASRNQRPLTTTLLQELIDPDAFPAWMTPADLDYFVANFEASGFRGPLNRYRNQERDYADLPQIGVAPVQQPSCFIAGSQDVVRWFVPGVDLYADAGAHCADFRFVRIIDGVGHWVQQEAPAAVNEALLHFLGGL
jgi:pimeloyl-ACP methyl ester carboxylesterase